MTDLGQNEVSTGYLSDRMKIENPLSSGNISAWVTTMRWREYKVMSSQHHQVLAQEPTFDILSCIY
jgi:hypothetical protein